MTPKYKPKHPPAWFKAGKVICAGEPTIFNASIIIEDKKHGKALHAKQDKGYRYNEVN